MRKDYPNVMSPVRVAGHLLKNRIISGPSTMHTASNGEPYPNEAGIRFFEDRARAGAGLVTCAGVTIGKASDDGVHAAWDPTVPNHTNMLCELAERIHYYGAKCTMELIGVLPDGWTVSDGCSVMGGPTGRGEAPMEVLEQFKKDYVETALTIRSSGFDGVLLHFGHSIPIAQFLSPLTNKRTDEYGGSLENRCRYPKEIIDAIRIAAGRDFIIDVRMSGTEFEEGGITLEEGVRIAEILQENADIIQASCGMHNSDWMTWTHPCGFLPKNPNVYIAENMKKSGKISKFVSTIGGIGSIADADEIIAAGHADFVVMARSFIADIDIVKKGLDGRQEDVVPCVKCMRCHDSDNYAQHMQCTVNPRVGLEHFLDGVPEPARSKSVAVIGGGPAGMKAALTAIARGHSVTLFEKEDHLGGKLTFASYVSFKYPLRGYLDYLIRQINKSPVEVKLSCEAKPGDLTGFDAVISAVGSEPLVPPIPGIENARPAIDVFGREDALGERIVVIGGGQVGLETALHLVTLGRDVTILEMQGSLAPDASKTHRDELMVEIGKNRDKLHVVLEGRCTGVEKNGVTYEKSGKSETIPADDIVLSAGMKGLTQLSDSFMGLTEEYAAVGDCNRARTVEWATKEGFYAAMRL